jgi:hypothetical protein
MTPEESLPRAARRIEWASRALTGAGNDLDAAGATAAAELLYEEAGRLERLAGEVRELEKVRA